MREPENVQDVIAAYNERERAVVARTARAKAIAECEAVARRYREGLAEVNELSTAALVALSIARDIAALKDMP
jgi:hypothetical protein